LFENRAFRRIFGPKRVEVTIGWRTLHNEGLNKFYSSPIIIRMIKSIMFKWAGYVARMRGSGMHIGYWWESLKVRKRPLGRQRRRWVDNIKMDHREVGWNDIDWIDLA
jgi:hypothetical protein